MNNFFNKYNIFKLIIITSLVVFCFCSFLIFVEFNKIKKTNNNITFFSFLNNSINEIINSTFQNKRLKKINNISMLTVYDEKFNDKGYILFSGYDYKIGTSVTNLFSLEKNKIIHKWIPPIDSIHMEAPEFVSEYNLKKNYRMQHPLLINNGNLIFGSGEGPIAKINSCSKLIWAINEHFHHSIERYNDGYISVPTVIKNNDKDLDFPYLDHGFAIVDVISGSVIKRYSIIDILKNNNFIGLLFGVGEFEYDRVHLNDAEFIAETDKYFNKGDVMLSSKHLSTVFVFRPSSGEIIWLKTGPWLNQHDIDYQGNGIFTIYGNDTFRYGEVDSYDVFLTTNNIYMYDFSNDLIKKIFLESMKNIKTPTQGLHSILNNGDLFIEETDNFKIYRFGKNNKRWEFVNLLDNGFVGSIHWSRYLGEDTNIDWISKANCELK